MAIETVPRDNELWGPIADIINANFANVSNNGSSEHLYNPTTPLLLTSTWQVVTTDWVEGAPPDGVVLDNATGSFELSTTGRWESMLERIYHQHDVNPATPVIVYIKVQTSDDEVTWVDTGFERSSIMSAATANDEPAVQSFTTAFFVDVSAVPVYFRVLVKADEGGADPTQTELILMKSNSKIISNVPA